MVFAQPASWPLGLIGDAVCGHGIIIILVLTPAGKVTYVCNEYIILK